MNNYDRTLLNLQDISKQFGDSDRCTSAVKHASCEVRRGEMVVVLGPSGSGKTTLLQMAAGLIAPTEGRVELLGRDLMEHTNGDLQRLRARRIGFIFQTCRLLDPLNATDNVALAAEFAGSNRAEAVVRARQVLAQLGVEHLARAYPPSLSQGERQRVAVARALVNAPDLLFADEPTASLESSQGLRLIEILSEYVHAHEAGLIVATHDLRLIAYADRVLRIEDGVLARVDEFIRLHATRTKSD